MSDISTKDLKSFAAEVWDDGYHGAASVKVKFIQPISTEKVEEIKAAFKPLIEKKLAEYSAIPKREFNKRFIYNTLTVNIKLHDADIHPTQFTVDAIHTLYTTRYVHGHEIKTLLKLNDILDELSSNCLCLDNDTCCRYKSITKSDDGSYVFTSFKTIRQPEVEITRKNWARSRARKSFQDLVCSAVKMSEADDWNLISASYVGDYVKHPLIVFKKIA